TVSPTETFEVNGSFRLTDGNQQAGYLLVTDANGTGNWTDPTTVFTDTDTDDQTLSLTGTTLSIADGNSVDLASIDTDTDTDDQTLSLVGTTLTIADGNSVDLASIDTDTDTDDQTLSLVGTTLAIADGNSVDLASIDTDTDTDDQTLSLVGTTLSIADGNSVDLSSIDTDTDTDDQTLSLVGTTLSIADGNSVDLTGVGADNDWTATGNNLYSANSGNVGIGTNIPAEKLHIRDGILRISHSTSAPQIDLVDDADGSSWTIRHQRSADRLEFSKDASSISSMIIHNNQNVGVGNFTNPPKTPLEVLHVNGNAYVQGNIIAQDTIQAKSGNGLIFSTSDGLQRLQINSSGTLIAENKIQAEGTLGLALATDEGTSRLEINNAGNVKIGTNGTYLNRIVKQTISNYNIPNIPGNDTYSFTVTVTGAVTGSVVYVTPELDLPGSVYIAYARVTGNNTVKIWVYNEGSNGQDPAAMDLYIAVIN
ncbi:MAG: hypothetical protein KDC44_16945, partial [Phaeodactylibacter sp.]|nr:hypothetical protein [Phaeodactylibacter sp.]